VGAFEVGGERVTLGLVGARGYVGQELTKILARHPRFALAFVASKSHAGRPVVGQLAGAPEGLVFEDLGPEAVAAKGADAVVLALSNDQAPPYAAAIDAAHPGTVIVDVSADHRFDDAWVYGLPEINRARIRGARRIANPGCYATAAALAVAPLREGALAGLLTAPAHAFGVSGYSGAGATPSPRNDVALLRDNIIPYSLVDHTHEREVTRHAGPVRLLPHVAPFFRGITMTVSLELAEAIPTATLRESYERFYAGEPLVRVVEAIPLVRDAANAPHATLGGFATGATGETNAGTHASARHGVLVVTLDNLLKGAASQAVQNLNLAFGFPELEGILPWPR
jgi:N-acetyl-gamma-glutamyl-phosphate reductase common form